MRTLTLCEPNIGQSCVERIPLHIYTHTHNVRVTPLLSKSVWWRHSSVKDVYGRFRALAAKTFWKSLQIIFVFIEWENSFPSLYQNHLGSVSHLFLLFFCTQCSDHFDFWPTATLQTCYSKRNQKNIFHSENFPFFFKNKFFVIYSRFLIARKQPTNDRTINFFLSVGPFAKEWRIFSCLPHTNSLTQLLFVFSTSRNAWLSNVYWTKLPFFI